MASTYTVERSTTIAAPPETVFEQLVDFRNWRNWSPWEEVDPQLQRTYSGADRGVGSVYEWSGNKKAGQGRMEIVEADEPSLVAVDLRFIKPFKSTTDCRFRLTPDDGGSRVVWTMTGPRPLVLKIMGLFISMDKMIGPDFEKGLARLKTTAEG